MLLKDLKEASYEGNIGAMEVMKFYQQASDDEKESFKSMVQNKEYNDAWELVQNVTGVRLHPMPNQ